MSVDMVWEDPPPITAKQVAEEHNRAMLEQLQAHPGKWARVATDVVTTGSAMTWTRWGCEVRRSRTSNKGLVRVSIWARWPE